MGKRGVILYVSYASIANLSRSLPAESERNGQPSPSLSYEAAYISNQDVRDCLSSNVGIRVLEPFKADKNG